MKKKLIIAVIILITVCGGIWGARQIFFDKKNSDLTASSTHKDIKVGLIADYLNESSLTFYKEISGVVEYEKTTNPLITEIVYPQGGTTFKAGVGRKEALEKLIGKGVNLVLSMSFTFSGAVKDVSVMHPEVEFVALDGFLPGKYPNNVTSYQIPFAEMGFLAGALSALKSNQEKVAILLDTHSLESDELTAGFIQGVRYIQPHCVVETIFMEKLNEVLIEGKDKELLEARLRDISNRGVDVIFSNVGEANQLIAERAGKYDFKFIATDTDHLKMYTDQLDILPEGSQKYCLASVFIDYGSVFAGICQDFISGKLQHKNIKIGNNAIVLSQNQKIPGMDNIWNTMNGIQQDLSDGKIKVDAVLEHGGVYK